MEEMNVFRVLGDISHTLSKCILIVAILRNKSAEGVSLITQAFYAMIFCTRYLDIFYTPPSVQYWNFTLKIFYTVSSFYILYLMLLVYARTREREKAWKLGAWCLGGSLVTATIILVFLPGRQGDTLYVFSLILESVCVLPQLLLLRQTSVPTVIDSFYLLTLGSYRAFYILNWIERKYDHSRGLDPISIIFGCIQTALYVDFAWIYYSRQRVKLRSGGLVDGEDLRRGWLVSLIFGKRFNQDEESTPALRGEEEEDLESGTPRPAPPRKGTSTGWGKRGISVTADDSVMQHERERQRLREAEDLTAGDAPDAKMRDPDELAMDIEDDSDDDALPSAHATNSGVSSGEEWRDGSS